MLIRMSGGHTGQLKSFAYTNYSKKEVNHAIQCLFKKHTDLVPPLKYKSSMIHYYRDLYTPESRAMNADTVQFHFYIKTENGNEVLFWLGFSYYDIIKEWEDKPSELVLIGYRENENGMKTQKDFGIFKPIRFDKKIKLFEKEILPKIKYFLEHPEECKP